MNSIDDFITGIPKAELHLHIEGTLEPELMVAIGRRNGVALPFPDAEAARKAYRFSDLQSFLDIYYRATAVLITEEDFYELTMAYLKKAASEQVRHAEIFFDPQSHTARGVAFETVVRGIERALVEGQRSFDITTRLIMCILRHLSEEEGLAMLEHALRWKRWIAGIGLDSSERGNPPGKFKRLFERAQAEGFLTVAHAGEEGGANSIREALDLLHVSRIDHGVHCMEDEALVEDLVQRQVPLTVCPLSNVRLRVFSSMREHNLKAMLQRGLCVTINSDDPAYFGGYINENYLEAAHALQLERKDIVRLAQNSFAASSLSAIHKELYLKEIERYVAEQGS
ncbi:MAG: adenosine deaminase [Chlorobium sp.]|nr:MAG: adenosine deaminase [Chlorobium sp.]